MEITASLLSLFVILPLTSGFGKEKLREPVYPAEAYEVGRWGEIQRCDEGTAMSEAQLLIGVHKGNTNEKLPFGLLRSSYPDKLFMIGLWIVCTDPNGKRRNGRYAKMNSTYLLMTISQYCVGLMPSVKCTKGKFFKSVSVRAQKSQGREDDGAAITANFNCTDGVVVPLSEVMSNYPVASTYWTSHNDTACPPGHSITRVQVKADNIEENGTLREDAGGVTAMRVGCEYGPVYQTPQLILKDGYWTDYVRTESNWSHWINCSEGTFVRGLVEIYKNAHKLIAPKIVCVDIHGKNFNRPKALHIPDRALLGRAKLCNNNQFAESFALLERTRGTNNQMERIVVSCDGENDSDQWFRSYDDKDKKTMGRMMTRTKCPEGFGLCRCRLLYINDDIEGMQGGCCPYQ